MITGDDICHVLSANITRCKCGMEYRYHQVIRVTWNRSSNMFDNLEMSLSSASRTSEVIGYILGPTLFPKGDRYICLNCNAINDFVLDKIDEQEWYKQFGLKRYGLADEDDF